MNFFRFIFSSHCPVSLTLYSSQINHLHRAFASKQLNISVSWAGLSLTLLFKRKLRINCSGKSSLVPPGCIRGPSSLLCPLCSPTCPCHSLTTDTGVTCFVLCFTPFWEHPRSSDFKQGLQHSGHLMLLNVWISEMNDEQKNWFFYRMHPMDHVVYFVFHLTLTDRWSINTIRSIWHIFKLLGLPLDFHILSLFHSTPTSSPIL